MTNNQSISISTKHIPAFEYILTLFFCIMGTGGAMFLFRRHTAIFQACSLTLLLHIFLVAEYLIRRKKISLLTLAPRLGHIVFPLELLTSAIILNKLVPTLLFPIQAIWVLMLLFYNSFRIKSQAFNIILNATAFLSLLYSLSLPITTINKSIYSFICTGIIIIAEVQRRVFKDISREIEEKANKITDDFITEIESTQREIIFKFSEIAESRSRETGNHVRRVAEYSRILALTCGLDSREADLLTAVSPMHDIGKIGIPESILSKPGSLTDEERKSMQKHAEIGYNMLKNSSREIFNAAAIVAHEHHEKYDGSGYPLGKSGTDIHPYGRITAVADVFDALASNRCYKKAWPLEKILILFKTEKGRHFDPMMIDAFFQNLDIFITVKERFVD